jgi:hypothetical protein
VTPFGNSALSHSAAYTHRSQLFPASLSRKTNIMATGFPLAHLSFQTHVTGPHSSLTERVSN